uniref:Uncharacterized protein n=1 Tax=Rhizophora mucronata TaxID=61149 RepID=A0A2P2PXB4_RHIMU
MRPDFFCSIDLAFQKKRCCGTS